MTVIEMGDISFAAEQIVFVRQRGTCIVVGLSNGDSLQFETDKAKELKEKLAKAGWKT